MKRMALFLIPLFFISTCIISAAEEDEYEYTSYDKFTRGIFNSITFPLEIPITIHNISVEKNPLIGILFGLPVGIGKSVIRMCIGLVEFTTFPFEPYEPIIEPEYLFKKSKI